MGRFVVSGYSREAKAHSTYAEPTALSSKPELASAVDISLTQYCTASVTSTETQPAGYHFTLVVPMAGIRRSEDPSAPGISHVSVAEAFSQSTSCATQFRKSLKACRSNGDFGSEITRISK